MFKFLGLIALLAFVSASPMRDEAEDEGSLMPLLDDRIINGEDTTIEKNPHQVSLQRRGRHFCGGSIITKNWVLTAGHCIASLMPDELLAGTADMSSGGTRHRVIRTILHEDFGPSSRGVVLNDIALIRVAEPFKIDETRRPIALYEQNEEALNGSMAVITGWGTKANGGSSVILQSVEIPMITKERCEELYKNRGGIAEGQICAAYEKGGKDSCQGDSGGPLSIDGRLAGIVSWGFGCAVARQPGVYSEIAYHREWIRKNMLS